MNIADRVRRFLNFGRTRPENPYRYAQMLGVPLLPAGIHLTMDSALELSVVWACMDAITKAIASCRWNILTVDGSGRRDRLPNDSLDYLLNTRPNPDMTAMSVREALMYSALSWGNGFAEIVLDRAGRVSELWPLMPDRVIPRRDPETMALFYEYLQPDGGREYLDPSQVFHLRGPGLNGLMGDNMVARAAKSIALAVAAERFSSTYFGNNTAIGGVLEVPHKLNDESYERIKTSWNERHQGPDKANKMAILEAGVTWKATAVDPAASQLIDSRTFQIEEICRWYGVPPHKVQHLTRATFNNIEHLGIEFVRDALTPWALRLEQEADYKLFSKRGPNRFSKLDMAWLSYGDAISRSTFYKAMREMGAYSVNDILVMEGRNTIGAEGDIRIVPVNMQAIERLEDPPPAAPGLPAPTTTPTTETETDDTPTSEEDANPDLTALARRAVIAMFAQVLDRYGRRFEARRQDRVRNGCTDLAERMAEERDKLRPWLRTEAAEASAFLTEYARNEHCAERLDNGLLDDAADSVAGGMAPATAAEVLLSGALA